MFGFPSSQSAATDKASPFGFHASVSNKDMQAGNTPIFGFAPSDTGRKGAAATKAPMFGFPAPTDTGSKDVAGTKAPMFGFPAPTDTGSKDAAATKAPMFGFPTLTDTGSTDAAATKAPIFGFPSQLPSTCKEATISSTEASSQPSLFGASTPNASKQTFWFSPPPEAQVIKPNTFEQQLFGFSNNQDAAKVQAPAVSGRASQSAGDKADADKPNLSKSPFFGFLNKMKNVTREVVQAGNMSSQEHPADKPAKPPSPVFFPQFTEPQQDQEQEFTFEKVCIPCHANVN
jgi:hypothetical protein